MGWQGDEDVQIALDPSEMENLDAATFKAKYEQQRAVRTTRENEEENKEIDEEIDEERRGK